MQLDEDNFVISGKSSFIFEMRPKVEESNPIYNLNYDKNMFLHYFWRVKQDLMGDFETKPMMDLLWVEHDYKMMLLGSTSETFLYLYNFHFKRYTSDDAAKWHAKNMFCGSNTMRSTCIEDVEHQLDEKRDDSVPKRIALDFKPQQILTIGSARFIILYSDTGSSVKRDIFEVTQAKDYSKKRVGA